MNGFSTEILKMVVGHCAQNIGWNGIQASSLDVLTEVLQKYLVEMGSLAQRYAEQFGRTDPNLDDIGLTFREMGITIQDLYEYCSNVEPLPFSQDVAKFPVPGEQHLNFLKPGSSEILCRPVHIYEYLPPMHQIIPDEDLVSEEILDSDENPFPAQDYSDALLGGNPVRSGVFKKPDVGDKKKGVRSEEEGQPWREITSVMMTTSGFLSSSREGKLPEARINRSGLDLDSDLPVVEKKVNMKKLIEGVKKTDEVLKRKENKEAEIIEKDPEQDKEKERTKKKKPKVLEEFAFFEKEKASASNKVGTSHEIKPPTDSTKQKLNIFRKIPKSRDSEGISPSGLRSLADQAESSTTVESIPGENVGPAPETSTATLSGSEAMPSTSNDGSRVKPSKKERKVKPPKDTVGASLREESALFMKESKPVSKKEKSTPWISESFPHGSGDAAESDERRSTVKDKAIDGKSGASNSDSVDLPKKKRSRPSTARPPSDQNDAFPTQTHEATCPTSGLAAPPAKPFFPFPSQFPVPGLIPPPLFQNVPFNLLGMPLGLRPPMAMPHPAFGPVTPNVSSPVPPPSFFTPPRNEGTPKSHPTTKKTSPNIVDSLPEAAGMLIAGPSSAVAINDGEQPTVKKEKREKKDKEKKKKDKKLKDKDKSDDNDRKMKREKKKDKKDKSRDKEEGISTVPKITFKFGAAPVSPRSQTPESTPKVVFKPMADRETLAPVNAGHQREAAPASPVNLSVDVAKFSALVTRPPKTVKPIKKEVVTEKLSQGTDPVLSPVAESSVIPSCSSGAPRTPSPSPKIRREKPHKPPKVTKDKEKEKKKTDKPGDVAVITETVGSYYDEFGNKIWICPACGRQDDGTPMIGCDECDDWYHWVCVGIRVPPAETESWFCQRCIAKKQGSFSLDKKKGRKKKSV